MPRIAGLGGGSLLSFGLLKLLQAGGRSFEGTPIQGTYIPTNEFKQVVLLNHTDTTGNNGTMTNIGSNALTLYQRRNIGATSFSPNQPFGWSIYLDQGGYVETSSNGVFAFGSRDFTIEASFCFMDQKGASRGSGFIWRLNPSTYFPFGQPALGIYGGYIRFCPQQYNEVTIEQVVPGKWYHSAYCRTGGKSFVFLNGKKVYDGTHLTGESWTESSIQLGGIGSGQFKGFISSVRVVANNALANGDFFIPNGPISNNAIGWNGANTNHLIRANGDILKTNTVLIVANSPYLQDDSGKDIRFSQTGVVRAQAFSPFPQNVVSYSVGTYDGSIYFPNYKNGSFSGASAYANTANANDGGLLSYGNLYIVSGQFYVESAQDTRSGYIMDYRHPNSGNPPQFRATQYSFTTAGATHNFSGTAYAGMWNHFILSRTDSGADPQNRIRCWLNGRLIGNNSVSGTQEGNFGDIVIGQLGDSSYTNRDTAGGGFSGYLYDLRHVPGDSIAGINAPFTTTGQGAGFDVARPSTWPWNGTPLTLRGRPTIFDQTCRTGFVTFGTSANGAHGNTSQARWGAASIYFGGSNTSGNVSTQANTSRAISALTPGFCLGQSDFTIEVDIYPQVNVADKGILQISDSANGFTTTISANNLALYITPSNTVGAIVTNGTANGNTSITYNAWNNIKLVRKDNITRLYVNFVQDMAFGNVADSNYYDTLYMGLGGYYDLNHQFRGHIDEPRVTIGLGRYDTVRIRPQTAAFPDLGNGERPMQIDVLCVGGGAGGGGGWQGGGGGAGGWRYAESVNVYTGNTYSITVGGGGGTSSNGGNSSIVDTNSTDNDNKTILLAWGGGAGAGEGGPGGRGYSGGSGGGGSHGAPTGASGFAGINDQGQYGGAGASSYLSTFWGGGGGGANTVGNNATSPSGPTGGAGTDAFSVFLKDSGNNGITFAGVNYICGGGAGSRRDGGALFAGGIGGGGASGYPAGTSGNTRSGGGGGAGALNSSAGGTGGSGGSGIVILRWPMKYNYNYLAQGATTGSPWVYHANGYTYYTFTGSGSITF